MPVKITSRARQLLIVRLNSGASLHLAPGESSTAVEEYELNGNEKLAKLRSSGQITIEKLAEPAPAAE